MKRVFIIFLIWLVAVNLFALLALNRFTLEPDTAYNWIDPAKFSQEQRWDLVSLHARWDSAWYMDIAENGYSLEGDHGLKNVVFFPLYPMLLKIGSFLLGGNIVLAGWIISSGALLGALLFLFRLARDFHPGLDSRLPLLFLLAFPTAFFLNAVYTESLFLLLSLASFYYARKGRPWQAGGLGFLAALTRPLGIALFLPLLWESWKGRGAKSGMLAAFLPLLGTLGFFLYHQVRFGDFFLFLRVQEAWGRGFALTEGHFDLFSNPAIANLALDGFFLLFALAALVFVFRRLGTSYGLYMGAILAMVLSTGTLMSIGRYELMLFPLFLLAASIPNASVRSAWLFVSLLLLSMNITLFVNNYWAG